PDLSSAHSTSIYLLFLLRLQKFYVIALALAGLVAADVSHLKLGQSADGGYGLSASSSFSSTLSKVVPGGDASSYQPAEYTPEHLKKASSVAVAIDVIPGGDSSSYQPAEYTPEHLKTAEVVLGGDSSSYQPAEYTPDHLKTTEVVPGGDSSSYQPAEYTPAHLKKASSVAVAIDVIPGGDSSSYQPAEYTPEHLKTAEVVPGGDSSSYQPAEYTPAHLKTAEVVPGGDSSSYQPAEYTPAHLKVSVPAAFGADTHTPEKFIPQADREAHYKYIQEQQQAVVSGGDSSSYQPAEYTTSDLKVAVPAAIGADSYTPEQFIPQVNREAHYKYIQQQQAVVSGGDSSSYQPAEYTTSDLKVAVPAAIGADSYTPEQFIPQADREAHYKYIQQQQPVVPGGDSSSYQPAEYTPAQLSKTSVVSVASAVVPGGDASSYQPAKYTPQTLKAATVVQTSYVQSQAKAVVPATNLDPAYVQGHTAISNQLQAPIAGEASRVYEEPASNGIEEFNPETHVPVLIGADTITPAHLRVGTETQYAANGGYVY
ncbi:hypothetical protein KR054_005138, partial [Drosophila jambulina]